MPITQDRMEALVSDAMRLKLHFESLKRAIRNILVMHQEGQEGFTTAQELEGHIGIALQLHPDLPLEAVTIEQAHFAKHARRNQRARLYAQRRSYAKHEAQEMVRGTMAGAQAFPSAQDAPKRWDPEPRPDGLTLVTPQSKEGVVTKSSMNERLISHRLGAKPPLAPYDPNRLPPGVEVDDDPQAWCPGDPLI